MANNKVFLKPGESSIISPQTNIPATKEELLKMQEQGYDVGTLPTSIPETQTQLSNKVNTPIATISAPNQVESSFARLFNPLKNLFTPSVDKNTNDQSEPSTWDKVSSILGKTGGYLGDAANYVGRGLDVGAESIGNVVSDIGNWADENRVGLGGLGTAIGAGLARRDPSEALARYNQSIIANKQQRQKEEELRMLRDPTHPYNMQFRELFKKMLPNVAGTLGDKFENMTVQNFKDANLTDLLDVSQKQIEISKNDPTSEISKRARDRAMSQYDGIKIPDYVSANEVENYIKDHLNKLKQSQEQQKIDIKKGELGVKKDTFGLKEKDFISQDAKRDIEKQQIINEENRKAQKQFFEIPQIQEETKKLQIESAYNDPLSERSKNAYNSTKNFVSTLFPKGTITGKMFSPDSVPENLSAKEYQDVADRFSKLKTDMLKAGNTREVALLRIKAQRDIEAIKQAGQNRRIQFQEAGRNKRFQQQLDLNRDKLNLEKLKEENKNPIGSIRQKDLDTAGLSKKALTDLINYSSDTATMKTYAEDLKDVLQKNGRYSAYTNQQVRGKLQSLHAQILAKLKGKEKLGALDAGVEKFVNLLITNPTQLDAVFSNNTKIISQLDTLLEGTETEEKNSYLFHRWDPRLANTIGEFQKLVKKAANGDKEAVGKFKKYKYTPEQINQFFENKLPLIGEEEE